MSLILNLIVLLILGVSIMVGAHRGLVLTLCGLVATLISFLGAILIANVLTPPLSGLIQPHIQTLIEMQIYSATEGLSLSDFDGMSFSSHQGSPSFAYGHLNTSPLEGLDFSDLEGMDFSGLEEVDFSVIEGLSIADILSALEEMGYGEILEQFDFELFTDVDTFTQSTLIEGVAQLIEDISAKIAYMLVFSPLFFLSFFLLQIILFFVVRTLNLVAKLPLLDTVNRGGGGACGLIVGLLILWVIGFVVSFLNNPLAVELLGESTIADLNGSLLGFFINHNPLHGVFPGITS